MVLTLQRIEQLFFFVLCVENMKFVLDTVYLKYVFHIQLLPPTCILPENLKNSSSIIYERKKNNNQTIYLLKK